MKGRDVKIEESVLRIKDLDIPTNGGLVGPKRQPIKASKLFLQRPSKSRLGFNTEKLRGRCVDKLDFTLDIGHNDALLQGVENPFQKPFLAREPDEIVLHLFRVNPPDSLN